MDNSVVITIIILVLIVLLFVLVSISGQKVNVARKKKLLKRLEELKIPAISSDSAIRRDSIIKLDNLLSKSLQYYFNNTNLCGDNLKLASKIFKKREYNNIWEAHKIRNRVVHDDYDIKESEAKEVYNVYKMSILKVIR
ncbi:MAG: hypothetical protein AB9915_02625 [Candidatus Dojkabacteria bacterium]